MEQQYVVYKISIPKCLNFITYFNRRLGTWLLNVMWIYSVGNASLHILSEPGRVVSPGFSGLIKDVKAGVVKSGVRRFIPAPLVKLVWSWKCAKYSFFRSAGRAYWTSQTPRYICDWIWARISLNPWSGLVWGWILHIFQYFTLFQALLWVNYGSVWLMTIQILGWQNDSIRPCLPDLQIFCLRRH